VVPVVPVVPVVAAMPTVVSAVTVPPAVISPRVRPFLDGAQLVRDGGRRGTGYSGYAGDRGEVALGEGGRAGDQGAGCCNGDQASGGA
jgi:hypothetical protein